MKLRTPPLTTGCDQRWCLKSQVGNSVGQMELPILGPIPFGQVNVIFPYINGKKHQQTSVAVCLKGPFCWLKGDVRFGVRSKSYTIHVGFFEPTHLKMTTCV